jgi:hypothetical protein
MQDDAVVTQSEETVKTDAVDGVLPEEGNAGEQKEDGISPQPKEGELPDDFKGRLAREKKRHDREIADLKRQNDQMLQMMQMMQAQGQTPSQPASQPAPQEGSSQDVDKIVEQKLYSMLHQVKEQNKEAEVQKKYSDMMQKVKEADDIYPDFDEVVRADTTLPFTNDLLRKISLSVPDSVNPADVLYMLAKDRSRLNQIAMTHPDFQAGEIAKISAEIMANKRAAKKETSAPPPLSPLNTNPAGSPSRINPNATVDDLRKLLRDK